MAENAFDKFIQDKLKDHSSALPPDMWERIQPKKETNPKAGFWSNNLLRILLIVPASTAVIYFASKNLSGPSAVVNANNSEVAIKPISTPTEKIKTQKTSAQNYSGPLIDKQGSKEEQVAGTSLDASSNNSSSLAKNFPAPKASVNSSSFKRIIGLNKKRVNSDISINSDVAPAEERFYSNFLGKVSTASNKKNLLDMKNSSDLSEHLNNHNFKSGIDCPSISDRKRSDLFLEVFASPDYAMKRVSGNTNLNPEYMRRKDSSERMGISFTAGFRVSTSLTENLRLKTGLQYSQVNERFNYRSENERRIRTVVTVRSIVRSPGDTLILRDTSTVEEIGYMVKTTKNRYRSFDVPVLFGYEWGNENWKAGITTGIIFNLRSWQQGATLDTNYSPIEFNKSNSQLFKRNIGVGVYLGFSLLKSIGERSELYAEPYFRYNISNMTSHGAFNQKIHAAGLNVGVRYKIRSGGQRQ